MFRQLMTQVTFLFISYTRLVDGQGIDQARRAFC